MQRRRALLVHQSTGQPLDEHYQPLLTAGELHSANTLLAAAGLPFHWRPLPRLTLLSGCADLSTL